MSAELLLPDFAAAFRAGPAVAGGKGFQLGRLARYGLPVPDGFILSTAAHGHAMKEALSAATHHAGADPEALAALRARIEEQALPPDVARVLDDALRQRGWEHTPLAVRSSATMEDSCRASFAGIYRSELNVIGSDALARAVRTVWASLWTPQAVAYRQRLGLQGGDTGMAVVVMETGGYLSHGAIVAREFGIPAVANLPGILDALADGVPVAVGGQRGTVRPLS